MKRIIFMAAAIAAAFSLAACSVVEQFPDERLNSRTHIINVKFKTTDVETKAAFGEFNETDKSYPTFWTAADHSAAMSLNFAEPVEATVNKDEEVSRSATLSASFEDTGSPYRFYAFSPLSAVETISKSRNSWAVSIPTVQTPKADGLSCDEGAMLLYAKSEDLTLLPAEPVSLKFSHVTSYCRLALKNLAAAFEANGVSDVTVKSVSLTYSVPVAGDWYVNASDGSLEEKDASYTITLKPSISDLSEPTDLWFALAPCTLDGASLNVAVNTDKGSLSREVTFGTRTYAAGAVNKISMDMAKGAVFDEYATTAEETVYELVTNINNLSRNDEVVFVDAKVPSYAMTSTTNSTYGLQAVAKDAAKGFSYNAEDGYIRLPEGSDVMVMKVAGKSGSSFTFSYGNQYLQRSSNHILTLTGESRAFTLSTDNGSSQLTYKSTSGKTTYYIYYNDNYFKVSNNTSKTLAVFKQVSVTSTMSLDPDNDPVLQHDQYGAYLAAGSTTYTPGVTQLSREVSEDHLTFAIIFPSDNAVLEFDNIPAAAAKGDLFSLNVRKTEGRRTTNVGTFNVVVIKEEGAKLWLSDQNGNGFIVKR